MGAAASFQAAFKGRVEQEEFTQQVDFEFLVVGEPPSQLVVRNLVTRRVKTQTFTFSGLNETNANDTSDHTVADFSGTMYTVPFASSFIDGSHGTKVLETESVQVTRRRISPGLWDVIVKRTGSEYWVNNTKIIDGPSWM